MIMSSSTASTGRSPVEIVAFEAGYASDFARLNYQWIEEFFVIEAHDRKVLDDPFTHIIEPGGQIFLAKAGDQVVGTVALVPAGEGAFELAKMGVDPEFQGQKIGKRLMATALEYATQEGKERVLILSNTILVAALNLYIDAGFRPIALDPSKEPYQRVNIKLEKWL